MRDGYQQKLGSSSGIAISSKPLPAFPEPKRTKAHWDYLMDEMVWLSKEFQKERKWKQSQCRKFARIVERSKLDVESRRIKRDQQEKLAIRKKASDLSKMVMTWWSKIERVVVHKQQHEVEKIEKHRLDKRLDRLVAKTERCSKMLIERVSAFAQPQRSESQAAGPSTSGKRVKFLDTASAGSAGRSRGKSAVSADGASEASDVNEATSRKLDQMFRDEAGDRDYAGPEGSDGEDVEDDETTMAEEERKAAREGNLGQERKRELSSLKDDTEMPVEEILRRYYASMDDGAEEGDRGNASSRGNGAASTSHSQEENGDDLFKEERGDTEYQMSGDEADDELTFAEEERLARKEGGHKEKEAQELEALQKEMELPVEELLAQYQNQSKEEDLFKEERGDTEYQMSGDEADDELTFAEEERLARKEGGHKEKEAQELEALQKEMELPVEELLAQYQNRSEEEKRGKRGAEEVATPPLTRKRKAESLVSTESKRVTLGGPGQTSEGEGEERSAGGDFKPPFLLKFSLRDYQTVGLQWLAALRQKSLNGILADEMGLGKTIQTIALLADLACNHGYWGPHLIVVPTSVMLNWEMEFKKWCPAFKILTYYGTAKERQAKRQGWSKANSFHVCITTYTLILQDKNMFRRKKWDYLILDEAHMIKNWQSQRWQTLLRFHARRRILLTGTPLQNNLMELWSLMHFLMPKIFESHDEFKEWFNNPLTSAVEGQASLSRQLVKRLHGILRPFILRRLKSEVEKKLPGKVEHVVYCKLSKRQRNLYEDYVGSSEIQNTLQGGNYFSVFNVLMQLRKVCNHPDLFEGRAIKSAFDAKCISVRYPKICILDLNADSGREKVNLSSSGFVGFANDARLASWDWDFIQQSQTPLGVFQESAATRDARKHPKWLASSSGGARSALSRCLLAAAAASTEWQRQRSAFFSKVNAVRCASRGMYTRHLIDWLTIVKREDLLHEWEPWTLSLEARCQEYALILKEFVMAIPKARAAVPEVWCSHPQWKQIARVDYSEAVERGALAMAEAFHVAAARLRLFFPDRRLIQFDCGKLQQLAVLLRKLKAGGHRVLIFTQMSKMLDILESFLNLYSYTYLRLDGATKPEQRQAYTQRYNTDTKIFAFILSTRSGGVGINLTGADTVIFYDSDWNPAMDHQAQDRCHRIGQTREVHIYR